MKRCGCPYHGRTAKGRRERQRRESKVAGPTRIFRLPSLACPKSFPPPKPPCEYRVKHPEGFALGQNGSS